MKGCGRVKFEVLLQQRPHRCEVGGIACELEVVYVYREEEFLLPMVVETFPAFDGLETLFEYGLFAVALPEESGYGVAVEVA